MKNKLKHIKKEYLLLIGLLLFVYWQFWISVIKVANDFPLIQTLSLAEQFDLPRLWHERASEGLGEFGTFVLWSYPMTLLSGFLAKVGFDMSAQVRIVYAIPFVVLGIVGMRRLLKKYNISENAVFVSSFFYLTTTYVLLLIDGGQLTIALNYALFPLAYSVISDSIHKNTESKLIAVLIISLITALDVRMLFIIAILIVFNFIRDLILEKKERKLWIIRDYLVSGLVIFIGWTLLNIYWIIHLLKYPISSQLYSSLTKSTGIQPTTWKHALLLLQPHWYLNVFGKVAPIRWEFLLIPAMVFLVPGVALGEWMLRKTKILDCARMTLRQAQGKLQNKRGVVFWVIVAAAGIFLSKGINPPFGGVYQWLFENLPGFNIFRDSTKFFVLIALSYSVLIGFSVDLICELLNKWKMENACPEPNGSGGKWKNFLVLLILTSYFIILASPVWTNKMTGMFSKPVYEKESFEVIDMFDKDAAFSRIFYIPSIAPLGYTSPLHPAVEALRLLQNRPFAIGTVGSYESFNFLREAPFMGEIFKIAGIKYIYYPYPDTRREDLKKDNIDYYYAFLDQLTNLPWIEKRISESPVAVLQTKETKDRFFIADNTFYVVGSDRIYEDLIKIKDFDLSNNALSFVDEGLFDLSSSLKNENIKIINNGQPMDLLMSYVPKNKYIFPAKNINREPADNIKKNTGFWTSQNDPSASSLFRQSFEGQVGQDHFDNGEGKIWKRETSDFLWWRNFLQEKYGVDYQDFDFGEGWIIAEGENTLTVHDKNLHEGDILFVRVLNSAKGGSIQLLQKDNNDNLVPIGGLSATNGECLTKRTKKISGYGNIPDQIFEYDCGDYVWMAGDILKKSSEVTIKVKGEINAINAMVVISKDDLLSISKNILSDKVIDWWNISDKEKENLFSYRSDATIEYKRLDSTHYKVIVSGLNKPSTLAFSENYDERWQITDESGNVSKPYKIYSLINGFWIEKDGEYDLYFEPQKYILPSLIVSAVTLMVIFGVLFINKQKTGKNRQGGVNTISN